MALGTIESGTGFIYTFTHLRLSDRRCARHRRSLERDVVVAECDARVALSVVTFSPFLVAQNESSGDFNR
jgi:hypothetical protein